MVGLVCSLVVCLLCLVLLVLCWVVLVEGLLCGLVM